MVIKKVIALVAVLVFVFSFTAFADDELYVYGEDDLEYLCEALNMDDCDISYYCETNNITYLAVNRDNTKQIKRSEVVDSFSQKVVDLAVLEDSEILSIAKQISGFEESEGRVIKVNDVKLLKTEMKTNDSGGEYVLTQFVTVKNSKKITLSFYTSANSDRLYIEQSLNEQFPKDKDFTPWFIGGVVVLSLAIAAVVVLIVLDFKKKED